MVLLSLFPKGLGVVRFIFKRATKWKWEYVMAALNKGNKVICTVCPKAYIPLPYSPTLLIKG
jgi:hypothetical protein